MAPVIFQAVVATISEFINWSLTIVSVMIIWYIVKFFIVSPPTAADKEAKDKEWEERGAKMREALGKQIEDKKKAAKDKKGTEEAKLKEAKDKKQQKKDKKRKKDLTGPAKLSIVNALDSAEAAIVNLNKGQRKSARKKIKELNKHISEAWKNLQLIRRKYPKDDKKLKEVIAQLHAAQDEFLENVKGKISKNLLSAEQDQWDAAVAAVLPLLKNVRGSLGDAWNKIGKLP